MYGKGLNQYAVAMIDTMSWMVRSTQVLGDQKHSLSRAEKCVYRSFIYAAHVRKIYDQQLPPSICDWLGRHIGKLSVQGEMRLDQLAPYAIQSSALV